MNLYKEIEEKAPKQASIKFSLGTTYLMMKDHFNAFEYFKMAHQLEPNNTKYASAFNDLSAEMAKHQDAQQGVETQYQANGNQPSGNQMESPGQATQASAPGNGQGPNKQLGQMPAPAPQQMQHPVQQQMQQPMQQPMQQMQRPMQRPMQQPMQQPMQMGQGYQGGWAPPQNQYGSQAAYPNMSQGTFIPPDPQQYASRPQQQSQTPPQSGGQFGGGGSQFAGSNQYGGGGGGAQTTGGGGGNQYGGGANQNGNGGGNQYGGGTNQNGNGGGQAEYTPPPQAAPQGAFNPKLAQQLNSPGGGKQSKQDPMSNFGISGQASNEGIMVTNIRGGSRAARAGLKKGDVIRTVDGNEVMQPSQLNQAFAQCDSSQTVPLLIFRDGNVTPIQF